MNLETRYMGMKLGNPVIVGSCGLTGSVRGVQELEEHGAGAVVLKSLFEEEIVHEMRDALREAAGRGLDLDPLDAYDYQIKGDNLARYTGLIQGCKKAVSIPVIASVNCTCSHEWVQYARQMEQAGADALELNMFFLPTDFSRSAQDKEKAYFDIVQRVTAAISVPVALKISPYFADLGPMIRKLSNTGVSALVLFNRFYHPDFDIENFRVLPTHVLSHPEDLPLSLRWIAIMSGRVRCDLAASTGVHDGKALVKQLLAGAAAVQVVSTLYRNGKGQLRTLRVELEDWMRRHGYESIAPFRGKMSQGESGNPALYERVQFMKYFGGGPEIV